jgi:PAS domain-containing protein
MTDRAARGGGRAVAIPQAQTGYGIGSTYGSSGNGSGWFGPGASMSPQAPREVAGRAFDFPQGTNVNTQARAYEAISFAQLRAFADGYDLLRLVIETRKDQMERLRWSIQLKDSKAKQSPQVKNKIKELTKFFKKPDGEHKWNTWLRMVLEDLFVIDAATLHRRRTRSGKLVALDQIDGATIKRVIDDWGRTPEEEGAVCYQQILKGMPAIDYTRGELTYAPRNPRVHKVYGYSPVEQILMTLNIALRRQVFQLNFFTDGNIPAALIGVPESWTPDQIRTFQEWFDNILSGNLAEKRKARFVPAAVGKTYVPTQETELFGKAEEWLARVVCFAFNISPQPFVQTLNRATADVAQETAESDGLTPIQNWVKDVIDEILEDDLGADDFEFMWRDDAELDPLKRQQITSGYLKDGLVTINEGRLDAGREPYDDPKFDEPMFMTSNGLAPLTMTAEAQGNKVIDPKTGQEVQTDNDETPPTEDQPPVVDEGDPNIKKLFSTMDTLTELGDPDLLAEFLRKAILGNAPAIEEHNDE